MAIFDPLRRKVQGEWGGSAHSPDPTAQSVPCARGRRACPPGRARRGAGAGRGLSVGWGGVCCVWPPAGSPRGGGGSKSSSWRSLRAHLRGPQAPPAAAGWAPPPAFALPTRRSLGWSSPAPSDARSGGRRLLRSGTPSAASPPVGAGAARGNRLAGNPGTSYPSCSGRRHLACGPSGSRPLDGTPQAGIMLPRSPPVPRGGITCRWSPGSGGG